MALTASPQRSSRHADDGDLGDGRVLRQRLLDLDGIHVLAAADDHVLDPVGEEQVALVVEVAAVAGPQPPVGVSAAAVSAGRLA